MAETCRRVLEVEVPPDVVKKRADEIATQFQRRARLPGFRPGKAPLSIVRQRFREDIRSEVLRELVPEYVEAGARERKWDPIGHPSVSDIEYADDSPLKFKATLEVFPEFELGDYRGIMVTVPRPEVSEDEINQTLARLQEQGATYVNVDPRPVEEGDFASVAVQELQDDPNAQPGKTQEILCEIGGERTPKEFSENLLGAEVGEERTFSVNFGSGGEAGETAPSAKAVNYRVKVLGIKKKQLPELNDDFARELGGDFESLDAVRQRIREDTLKAKQNEADENARAEVRKKLIELHDFPVPDTLVERQIERRLENIARQIQSQGMNPRQLDWGRMRAAQRDAAIQDVKSSMILEKIAAEEKLEPEQAEVENEIRKIAEATRQTPEAIEAHLTKDGGLDTMKSRLRIEKSLNFVYQLARTDA